MRTCSSLLELLPFSRTWPRQNARLRWWQLRFATTKTPMTIPCEALRTTIADLCACTNALAVYSPAEHAICQPIVLDIWARIEDAVEEARELVANIESGRSRQARERFEKEREYARLAVSAYAMLACAKIVAEDGAVNISKPITRSQHACTRTSQRQRHR